MLNYLNQNFEIYGCKIPQGTLSITRDSTQITSVIGTHLDGMSSQDALGLLTESNKIHFFPTGIDKFLPNLLTIEFINCHMKEIHQADLKPFDKLKVLYLSENDIEILEDGLFDYNQELVKVNLNRNRIKIIEFDVFSYMRKLTFILVLYNPCFKPEDQKNDYELINANKMIQLLNWRCKKPEYLSVKFEMKEISENVMRTHKDLAVLLQLIGAKSEMMKEQTNQIKVLKTELEKLKESLKTFRILLLSQCGIYLVLLGNFVRKN